MSNAATTGTNPHAKEGTLGLAPAHTGYMYQDLVTAYFMAQGVIDKFDLRVDKKQFEGDVFDDLHLFGRRRIQLKSSLASSDPFSLEDLSTKRRNTRIDELLFAAKEDLLLLRKDNPCPRENELSCWRRMDSIAPIANQEWIADIGFHHFDLMANSRLGAQNMLGCFAEVSTLSNRNQVFQMAKLDDV